MSKLSYFFFEGFLMGTYQPKGKGIVFTPFKKYTSLSHLKNTYFPDDEFLHEAVSACFSPDEITSFRVKRARIERLIEEERFQSLSGESDPIEEQNF